MAYSLNDLKNAAQRIEDSMNERSQKKGEELANKIIHGNLIGFLFARWFNFLTIATIIGVTIQSVFNLNEGLAILIAMIASLIILKQKFFWYMYFRHAILLFIAMFGFAMLIDKL